MIDEGFNELVKLCELGRVLHVLEVLDLLVRDRVGADGDSGCLADLLASRAMLSFVAEGPTYDTGSCEVPSGYQVGKLLGLPNPLSLLLDMCGLYCPACPFWHAANAEIATRKQEPSKHSDLFISETVQILYKSRKVAVHHALHIILYTVPSLACANRIRLILASKLHCASRRLPHRPST